MRMNPPSWKLDSEIDVIDEKPIGSGGSGEVHEVNTPFRNATYSVDAVWGHEICAENHTTHG